MTKVPDDQILQRIALGDSARSISRALKVCRKRVAKLKKSAGKPVRQSVKKTKKKETLNIDLDDVGWQEKADEATATMTCTIPITKKDLAERFAIDLKKWECVEFRVKTWETSRADRQADLQFDEGRITGKVRDRGQMKKCPMYSAGARYVIRKESQAKDLAGVFRDALGKPKKRMARHPVETSEDIIEIALPDVHHGLRAIAEESGSSYDLRESQSTVMRCVEQLCESLQHDPVSRIVLPLGNDWLNSDNAAGTTAHGTPQDEDAHWLTTFREATKCAVEVVDYCRNLAGGVDVLLIPGNHDTERSYYLAECLQYAFGSADGVSIDAGLSATKARLHHDTLVGYHHGDGVQLSELIASMPARWPHLWAQSQWREWHLGHVHHEREQDVGGIRVRHFRCICASSAWAAKKNYNDTLRAATSIRYRRERGPMQVSYAYA